MKNQDRFQGWYRKALSILVTLAALALIALGSLSLSACGDSKMGDMNTYSEVIVEDQIAG